MTTEIDAEGLLPCPFCGEEPALYETEDDDNSSAPRPHRNYQVICDACECCGPKVESGMWWSATQAPPKHSADYVAEAKAIAAWNRRAASSTSEAEPVATLVHEFSAEDLANLYGGELADRYVIPDDHVASVKLVVQQAIEHDRRHTSPLPTPASDDQVEAVRALERINARLSDARELPSHALGASLEWAIDEARRALAAMGSTKP